MQLTKQEQNEILAEHGSKSLARLEKEINEQGEWLLEAQYQMGVRLWTIRTKRKYESEGFKTWSAYCKSDRFKQINDIGTKSTADRYIAFSEIRPLLPEVHNGQDGADSAPFWNYTNAEPLTKLRTKSSFRKAVNAVERLISEGNRLTPKLVREEVEKLTGEADEKRQREIAKLEQAETETAGHAIEKFRRQVIVIRKSLEQFSNQMWDEAEQYKPGCCKRFAAELRRLADFLSS